MPRRIQRRRAKGWQMPEGAVSVTRPGPWGNPFVVGLDGSHEECVRLYRLLMSGLVCLTCRTSVQVQQERRRYTLKYLAALRGKDLVCWCRLDQDCHADTLLVLANAPRPAA